MKKYLALILALCLVAVFAACGSSSAPSASVAPTASGDAPAPSGETYVLKGACSLAADHPYALALTYLSEQLAQRSNGRIQLDVYPAGQMGGETAYVEMLQMNTLDFAVMATAPLANFIDTMSVFDLPYLFKDTEHVYAVEDSEIGKALLEELQQINVRGMEFMECGFMELGCTKPLNTPADLKGLNVRIMENVIYQEFFSLMGANPITMSMTEVFTSLQNGTIDTVTNPVVTIYTSKLHTEAKHISMTDCIYIPAILLMSQERYNSLPADLQQIVTECCEDAKEYERGLFVDLEKECADAIVAEGGEFIEVDDEIWRDEAVIQQVYDKFVGSLIPADVVEQIQAMA